MTTQHKSKFRAPVFSRQPGFKNQTHDVGWVASIVAAIKAGTAAALTQFRQPVNYHGVPPHIDPGAMTASIEARPVSAPVEIADVPGVSDQTRDIGDNPPPVHPSMKR